MNETINTNHPHMDASSIASDPRFSRTKRLLGNSAMERLAHARVAVFGIGGVGGAVVEALARGGVGTLDLIDHDTVSITNINRQLIATTESIGRLKIDVAKERILSINPKAIVHTYPTFYLPETASSFHFENYDYVVDAIDTVTGKINLIMQAYESHTPIISSMGTGNKLNPALFEVEDIYKTSVCPLAKVMRKELSKRGIPHLKVVYSKEIPLTPLEEEEPDTSVPELPRKRTPGSTSFVPPVAGYILASEVIKDLIKPC